MTPSETLEGCSVKLQCLVNGHVPICAACTWLDHSQRDPDGCAVLTCEECGATWRFASKWDLLPKKSNGKEKQIQGRRPVQARD